jgi:DNA-directed RNA polymerase specialized sigma24 family protein
MLYYYQEKSVEDVALMLDLPEGTIKSHLFRARKTLAHMMKGAKRS